MPIRDADTTDVEALAQLRWSSRTAAEQAGEDLPAFTRRFATWFAVALASGDWHVAVADAAADAVPGNADADHAAPLVGCMYLQRLLAAPVPGRASRAWGCISHAYVADAARGQGIGSALLSRLTERARTLGLDHVQVWPSQRALSLYRRAGFLSPAELAASDPPEQASHVLLLDDGPR